MSRIHGLLDPETVATLEPGFAKLGAPGMCNPDDQTPCIDGEPDDATSSVRAVFNQLESALKSERIRRAKLDEALAGQHKGGIRCYGYEQDGMTVRDDEAAAGVGVTAGGTLLPMREVIRLASQSHHYLVVYDKHHPERLYCGRANRFATPGQRIVLHALERGCTRPGCTAPGYWTQVHHVDGWVANNGQTNINDLTLACGPDNRLVEEGGWKTRKRSDGRTEWLPPPHLDTGQSRVNNYHHPEKYLVPEDDDEDDP